MNTQQLIQEITLARIRYTKNNLDSPTKLYLDSVSAMKLEWHMKEHCNYTRTNDGKVVFAGMRVLPVMVAEEHINVA